MAIARLASSLLIVPVALAVGLGYLVHRSRARIEVEVLNLDAASFRQLERVNDHDGDAVRAQVLDIVSTRGMVVGTQDYHPEPRVAAIISTEALLTYLAEETALRPARAPGARRGIAPMPSATVQRRHGTSGAGCYHRGGADSLRPSAAPGRRSPASRPAPGPHR